MSFVKTAKEISQIEQLTYGMRFLGESISVEFETTREFVQTVLPPGLDPVTGDLGTTAVVQLTRGQGWGAGEYDSGVISLRARRGDREGFYGLTRWCLGTLPNQIGRELWGEVKKPAEFGYYRDEEYIYGWVARGGAHLIDLRATVGEKSGPSDQAVPVFEIKAFPAAMGPGLEYDPLLLTQTYHMHYHWKRRGTAQLAFDGTVSDPLHTIPVISVGEATQVSFEMRLVTDKVEKLCDADDYLPYLWGRHYDDTRIFPAPLRWAEESRRFFADGEVPRVVGRT